MCVLNFKAIRPIAVNTLHSNFNLMGAAGEKSTSSQDQLWRQSVQQKSKHFDMLLAQEDKIRESPTLLGFNLCNISMRQFAKSYKHQLPGGTRGKFRLINKPVDANVWRSQTSVQNVIPMTIGVVDQLLIQPCASSVNTKTESKHFSHH